MIQVEDYFTPEGNRKDAYILKILTERQFIALKDKIKIFHIYRLE
jgi:hypothetical protein